MAHIRITRPLDLIMYYFLYKEYSYYIHYVHSRNKYKKERRIEWKKNCDLIIKIIPLFIMSIDSFTYRLREINRTIKEEWKTKRKRKKKKKKERTRDGFSSHKMCKIMLGSVKIFFSASNSTKVGTACLSHTYNMYTRAILFLFDDAAIFVFFFSFSFNRQLI